MAASSPSQLTQWMAKVCMNCPVCRRARHRQRGWAFSLVKNVERGICPFCRAYTQVTGKLPHEPATD